MDSTHSEQIDASSLCSLEEGLESKDAFGRKITLLALEQVPGSVERNTRVPESLDLLEDIEPETRYRKSERVKLSAVEEHSFAMDEDGAVVPGA